MYLFSIFHHLQICLVDFAYKLKVNFMCDDSNDGKCGDGDTPVGDGDAIVGGVVMVLLPMVVMVVVMCGDTETVAGGCHLVETGDGISRSPGCCDHQWSH